MEMSYLRWILLGVAIIVVAGVYFFSRARKKTQPSSQLNAADKVPSFSAKEVATGNEWMDGVGPVWVVSEPEKNPQVDSIQANGPAEEPLENIQQENYQETIQNTIQNTQIDTESEPQPEKVEPRPIEPRSIEPRSIEPESGQNNSEQELDRKNQQVPNRETADKDPEVAIDDVVSVYVLAKVEEKIKGEKILSASYALHLDYGEMKIFHRHSQTPQRTIEFSMANIETPGWFDIDKINDMQTSGVSFFMQANLVDNPSAVLDEMLICAHNLSTMLGAMLCNGQRKILDEASTIELREKVKRLEEIKGQTI